MKKYYPYKATDGIHKFYIITNDDKKIYFGSKKYEDYTTHKNLKRKNAYILRHKKKENWEISGVNTAGWWAYKFLWSYPTKKEAYEKIKEELKEIFKTY
jgi:hypothetical protein